MPNQKVRLCPCGKPAVWYRAGFDFSRVPEHALCFLTDADFEDDYCDDCLNSLPEDRQRQRKRLMGNDPYEEKEG